MSDAYYYYMETVMKVAFFDFVKGKNIPRKVEYENKTYTFVDMYRYWAKRGWLQAWMSGKEVRI
jgi:hypothetical protein